MIKNIIFDLGNVLIKYQPIKFVEKYVVEKNRKKFFNRVFKGKEWLDLDRGVLSYEEAKNIFLKELPEDKEAIYKLFDSNILEVLEPIEENITYLENLKNRGYKLYILSNFHKPAFETIKDLCNFKNYFDGEVISCYCHLLKPEIDIYNLILNKYNLVAKETLFIDDTEENTKVAQTLGIKTITLKETKDLRKKLDKFLE